MDAAVHRALWITFLCRQLRDTPENVKKTTLHDNSRETVFDVLSANKDKIPPALLGVALWNLLPAFKTGALKGTSYEQLFKAVYERSPNEMQLMVADTETPAFPKDPQQSIQEPSLTQEENLNASTLRLEVRLGGRLDQLAAISVAPNLWKKGDNPFWKEVGKLQHGYSDGKVAAHVQLPNDTVDNRLLVELDVGISNGPFEARTDFKFGENNRTEVCYGYLSVRKDEGRPGQARVTLQRTVRFKPEFDQFRVATAIYWLWADLICGAHEGLQTLRNAALPPSRRLPARKKKVVVKPRR